MSTSHLISVQGTMKIHAAAGLGNSAVAVRNSSCYFEICLSESFKCYTLREEMVCKSIDKAVNQKTEVEANDPQSEEMSKDLEQQTPLNVTEEYFENEFVVAACDNKYFVGKVTEIGEDDNSLEISFMMRKKSLFQWPNLPDVLWIEKSEVVCKLDTPVPSGRSGRMWKFNNLDINQYNIA